MLSVNDLVRRRVDKLLKEKGWTIYRLEQESGILHGSMSHIMDGKHKNITLKTVMQLASGFGMRLCDFFDDEIFDSLDVDI